MPEAEGASPAGIPGRRLPLSEGAAVDYRRGVYGEPERPVGVQMTKDELIIQLVKVALGILIGGYFLWWSLEVLKRLPLPH